MTNPTAGDRAGKPADLGFQPLDRTATLSDRVTQAVLDHIIAARLKPGDRMPSERDLGLQFGVSRTVVREALRSLAAKGVLHIQSGSPATVAKVGAEQAGEALRLYVQGLEVGPEGVSYEQINDVRVTIESRVARLAATAARPEDLARLDELHQAFQDNQDDGEIASQCDVQLHRAIAETAHNPLFVLMLDSIEPILVEIRRRTLGIPGRPDRATEAHQLIIDRIRAQDADGAERAMNDHLEDSLLAWRKLSDEARDS